MDITNHSTAALSVKGPSALAIVLAGIATANSAAEHYEGRERIEKSAGNAFPTNYFARGASEQYSLSSGLLDSMSYLPATDLAEAAAQVGHALTVVNQTYDDLPDDESTNATFKKMEQTVGRLLHSAIRAIEAAGGFTLNEMGLSTIRGSHLDPWTDVDAVVARLQADGIK